MEMFNKIKKYAGRPSLFEKGTKSLWEDSHISKGMLNAHLSQNNDAATRRYDFLDKSVEWINLIVPPEKFPKLIDLGCGPGLYANRLYSKGYHVTGVDISTRSIEYAKEQAEQEGKNINYIVGNYLELNTIEAYDVAILIYCDFGALSDRDRRTLLRNVYHALKPNGKLIFDVFTPNQYTDKEERHSWAIYDNGGFYNNDPHICLYSHLIYEDSVRLDQYVLIDNTDKIEVINVWDKCFTIEALIDELESVGFKLSGFYSDVTGKSYSDTSETITVVVEK